MTVDEPVRAVRAALTAAGHDPDQLIVRRLDPPDVLAVTFNPHNRDDFRDEDQAHTAFAATLRGAGWPAVDAERLVLVPGVPPAGAAEGNYRAAWVTTIDGAVDAHSAAAEARETQIDPGITESLWTVTDHLGRITTVELQDPDLSEC